MTAKMGKILRDLRKEKRLTQQQVAEFLCVKYQTVSKWENDVSMPDTMMLPALAEFYGVTIDEFFGRGNTCCRRDISENDAAFLLNTYAQMYSWEAGAWNLSAANKYLEYRITEFFERNFPVQECADICNIGIGAGDWDEYLSFRVQNGSLTSIDRDEVCCKQLRCRFVFEDHTCQNQIICADALELDLAEQFDIVTMVGSTLRESGQELELFRKAASFLKPGGALYYQSLDERENCNDVIQTAYALGLKMYAFEEEQKYGYVCRYYRFNRDLS